MDFAHTAPAVRNRQAKAARLAGSLELTHRPVDGEPVAVQVARIYGPPTSVKQRRAAERVAGVPRSSDETWQLAFGILRDRPWRREGDPPLPGCNCRSADGLPGSPLYEELPADLTPGGWPCPHQPPAADAAEPPPALPAGVIVCGPREPSAADVAAVNAFAAALKATGDDTDSPPAWWDV